MNAEQLRADVFQLEKLYFASCCSADVAAKYLKNLQPSRLFNVSNLQPLRSPANASPDLQVAQEVTWTPIFG